MGDSPNEIEPQRQSVAEDIQGLPMKEDVMLRIHWLRSFAISMLMGLVTGAIIVYPLTAATNDFVAPKIAAILGFCVFWVVDRRMSARD